MNARPLLCLRKCVKTLQNPTTPLGFQLFQVSGSAAAPSPPHPAPPEVQSAPCRTENATLSPLYSLFKCRGSGADSLKRLLGLALQPFRLANSLKAFLQCTCKVFIGTPSKRSSTLSTTSLKSSTLNALSARRLLERCCSHVFTPGMHRLRRHFHPGNDLYTNTYVYIYLGTHMYGFFCSYAFYGFFCSLRVVTQIRLRIRFLKFMQQLNIPLGDPRACPGPRCFPPSFHCFGAISL